MNKIILTIIMFAICVALVISVVIPVVTQIKDGGQRTFDAVRNSNNNIVVTP